MGGFVKRYLTVPEVANYFSVSKSLVYEWVQAGKVSVWHPEGKIGSRGLRILSESILKIESSGMIDPLKYDE
jgi:excisionase family DNA binding protein